MSIISGWWTFEILGALIVQHLISQVLAERQESLRQVPGPAPQRPGHGSLLERVRHEAARSIPPPACVRAHVLPPVVPAGRAPVPGSDLEFGSGSHSLHRQKNFEEKIRGQVEDKLRI